MRALNFAEFQAARRVAHARPRMFAGPACRTGGHVVDATPLTTSAPPLLTEERGDW